MAATKPAFSALLPVFSRLNQAQRSGFENTGIFSLPMFRQQLPKQEKQQPNTVQGIINSAPEIPDVADAIAQTRQLVLRSFAPKPFGGALATSPFGISTPAPSRAPTLGGG